MIKKTGTYKKTVKQKNGTYKKTVKQNKRGSKKKVKRKIHEGSIPHAIKCAFLCSSENFGKRIHKKASDADRFLLNVWFWILGS
jgi:hypothetical protein